MELEQDQQTQAEGNEGQAAKYQMTMAEKNKCTGK
jgi:hypothetical protein